VISFALSMIGRGTSTRLVRRDRPTTAMRGGKASTRRAAGARGARAAGEVRLPYLPGLDGLRALAVIAVLLYHAELPWIPGGFLGVEVFFVISGYLITTLLLAEWRQRGRIDLKAFWLRRARRLLPALYLLLVVTLAYAVVFLPGEVAGLRGDVIAALGYVTNWYLVLGHESYFEAIGRPSLLKHLWSLAVEEQFYLLWPPVLALGLSVGATRWRERRVLLVALALAASSALLMAFLYRPEVDPSRVYFGADTRAAGLFIGAALAFAWTPWHSRTPRGKSCSTAARRLRRAQWRGRLRRRWGWTTPLLLDGAGLVALGGLAVACLRLGEFQPFLYRGGLSTVALATAVVIMACAHPRARLGGGLLGRRALRWIGVRSYGIYLWHWPVFMVTRPQLDVPMEGLPLLALRLAVTVVLADLSYRCVETPIRRGALGRAWQKLREAQRFRRRRLSVLWAGGAVPALMLCAALGVAVAQAEPPDTPSYLASKKAIHTERQASEAAATPEVSLARAVARDGARISSTTATPAARTQNRQARTPEEAPADAGATVGPVSAIGDSVMLGAAGELEREVPNLTYIDAEVGLQAAGAIDVLRWRRGSGELGEVVVVDIGNNGVFTAEQFDELMGVLEGVRRVVFVNVNVPRAWERPNNEVLAEGVRRYPNAVLVDWYSASVEHPEYFVEDGIHLRIEGQRVYAGLIAEALDAD
jgi:peptidoglycan/LPS O-acetylase OafA/YrhL